MRRFRTLLSLVLMLSLLFTLEIPAQAAGTYWIGVDLTNQITTIYRTSDNSVVMRMLCSTGLSATPTPTGTYTLPSKSRSSERTEWYYFEEFDCWAKYATRIKGGILFHSVIYSKNSDSSLRKSTVKALGKQASHGCIRLTVANAKWIAQNCPAGTKVKIYYGEKDSALKASLTGSYSTLKSGSSGSSVTSLQNRLKYCGWYDGSASGSYDSATETAVKEFQSASGLTADGIAGNATQTALFGSSPKIGMKTTLKSGMNSLAVKQLQTWLKNLGFLSGSADGSFGDQTKTAVMAYQASAGLSQTGIATPSLQKKLSTDKSTKPSATAQATVKPTSAATVVAIGTAKVKTNGGTLTMRATASSSGTILAAIPNGTTLNVLSTTSNWVRVQYGTKTGYVSASYVTLNLFTVPTANPAATATAKPTAAATVKPTATAAAYGTGVVSTNSGTLSLRKTAASNGTVLAAIPKGTKVTVLSVSGDWARVTYKTQTGYVAARYLTITVAGATAAPTAITTAKPTATPKPASIGTATVKTNGGTLALRATASSSGTILARLANGAKVTLHSISSGWAMVSYGSKTGYVNASYLKTDAAATVKPTIVPWTTATPVPTAKATAKPTAVPTAKPTEAPTAVPTAKPTEAPTAVPTAKPTEAPTAVPTAKPTEAPAENDA